MPASVLGVGPELPRRGLFVLPLAALSRLVGGGLATWLLLTLSLAVAFLGAARLVRPAPLLTSATAGALYAASPFVLTRIGVGHIALVVATALLPWAAVPLLEASSDLRRALQWGTAVALTGPYGGLLALALFAAGLVNARRGRWSVVLVAIASQLPWLVPSVFALLAPHRPVLVSSASFPTDAQGALGGLAALSGHGFWAAPSQVGGNGTLAGAIAGVVLAGLAWRGRRHLRSRLPGGLGWAAAVGLGLTLASALPGPDRLLDWATGGGPGQAFRESQRFLPLFLLWLAPAAALGAATIARQAAAGGARAGPAAAVAAPLLLAIGLALPAFPRVGHRLDPVSFPATWEQATTVVSANRGTVLALPWTQYVDLPLAGSRRVIHPAREWFGDDVLWSTDPGAGTGDREQYDRRQALIEAAIHDMTTTGQPISTALRRVGVRWVVDLPDVDADAGALAADTGLQRIIGSPTIDLYAVVGVDGDVVGPGGAGTAVPLWPGIWRLPSGAATWYRAPTAGWVRGLAAAPALDVGVRVPAGDALMWFWPSIATQTIDLVLIVVISSTVVRRYRRRSKVLPLAHSAAITTSTIGQAVAAKGGKSCRTPGLSSR